MAYGIINGGAINGEGDDGGIGTGGGDPGLMLTIVNTGFVATIFGSISEYPTPVIPITFVRIYSPPRTSLFGKCLVSSALTATQSASINSISFGASSVLMTAEFVEPIDSTAFGESSISESMTASPIFSMKFGSFRLLMTTDISPINSTAFGALSANCALTGILDAGIASTEFGSAVADQMANILPAFAGSSFGRLVIMRSATC